MLLSLLHAAHANALRDLKSFSESIMYEPRYLKSSTSLMVAPESDRRPWWFGVVEVYSVFTSLQCSPTSFAAFSSDCKSDSAFSTSSDTRARSSAKSRSVRNLATCL